MKNPICLDSSSLKFIKSEIFKTAELKEKKKLAARLYQLTDLSITQIAELVEIDKGLIERELSSIPRNPSKARYQLQERSSETQKLLNQIEKKLKSI